MKFKFTDGRVLVTPCTGCMCHDMPEMKFGDDPNKCTECGCPIGYQAADKMWREKNDRASLDDSAAPIQ